MKPRKRRQSTFDLVALVSTALIGQVLLLVGLARDWVPEVTGAAFAPPAEDNASRAIDVTMIEPSEVPVSTPPAAQLEAEREKKIEEARKPEEEQKPEGQVVDQAQPDVEIRPDQAKFLSEYDVKVAKETRGAIGREKAGAREAPPPRPTTPTPPSAIAQERKEATPPSMGGTPGNGELAMRAPAATNQGRSPVPSPPLIESKEGGADEGMEKRAEGGSETAKGAGGPKVDARQGGEQGSTGGGDGGPGAKASPSMAELRPSDQTLSHALGAGSMDYLKDVDEGEETLVNTKRWTYASFFNRVKHAVANQWHPENAYRLRDPTGNIYGLKNRLTILKVSIAPDGQLRNLAVEKPCGVDFLDDEAITAFRGAQPFPNPPPGLVDRDSNLITFRFGFYFEITGAPTFRVFH